MGQTHQCKNHIVLWSCSNIPRSQQAPLLEMQIPVEFISSGSFIKSILEAHIPTFLSKLIPRTSSSTHLEVTLVSVFNVANKFPFAALIPILFPFANP